MLVAGGADHEGLAAPFGHELCPFRLWLTLSFEVGEFSHLMDLDGAVTAAQFAPAG